MVYYKDNPDLKQLQTVKTVKGDVEYRKNTKFISEKYYTINRDCFQIEDKWYRIDSGNIAFDHELKTYFLVNRPATYNFLYGIVLEDDNLALGYFTENKYNNVVTNSNKFGRVVAINSEILLKNGWFEDMGGNIWYNPSEMTSSSINSRKLIRNEKAYTDRGYNIEDNRDYQEKIFLYDNYPTHITPKAKEMSKYLGDLTFGVEIELQRGNIGNNLRNRYGVVICRDGSLNGGAEIVTVPLKGAKGLQTTVNLANDLKHRSDISLDCSLHIHFGNFKKDKLSIIALYRLLRNVQNELFSMFPYYKTEPSGIKQKNYTKKLLKLNIHSLKDNSKEAYKLYILDCWSKLFNFYSEGRITQKEFNKKTREHPIRRKWEMKNRFKK